MGSLSWSRAGVGRLLLACALSGTLAWPSPAGAASAPGAAQTAASADAVRDAIDRIPILAEVSIGLVDGSRVKGLLRARTTDTLTVGPRRGSGPGVSVPVSSIKTIKMKRPDEGIGAGKAIVIGVAAGTAAFVTLLLILLSNAGA